MHDVEVYLSGAYDAVLSEDISAALQAAEPAKGEVGKATGMV